MTQQSWRHQVGSISLGAMLLGACYVEPVEQPIPARSAFDVNVLDARPTGLVVQADKPLSWVVVEMRPAGQVWVVYADSSQPAGDSGRVIDTLRFDRRSEPGWIARRGRFRAVLGRAVPVGGLRHRREP